MVNCGRAANHHASRARTRGPLAIDLNTLDVTGVGVTLESTADGPAPAGDVAIAPPPDQFDDVAGPPTPPPAQLRADPFAGVVPSGGTWAVMIGINDYPGSGHDLRSAVNDVSDINQALAAMAVPGDHRLLITDRQATAGVIRLAADWLVAHAAPNAVAVFAYAGHVRKLSSDTEAIVAADGGLVTDTDLAGHLSRLKAARTWLAMAACYGGGFTELLGPGRVLTAAAGPNSVAYENESFGRSYMVEYMIRQGLIEGRAAPNVQAAYAYARAALAHDYPNRQPVEYDNGAPVIDFGPRQGGSPPPPPSQPPPSGSGGGQPSGSTTTTTAPSDGCKQLTLGVVSCH